MINAAKIIVISAFLAFCSNGFANELLVPSQYPTIQSAINATNNGDVVIVAADTYTGPGNRDIDFLGKAITVRSETGPENCIIDCQLSGRGFRFRNNEDANSVLDGFTITNGYASQGGGILCEASPTIIDCNITHNSTVEDYGGGIYCNSGNPNVTECSITNNRAIYAGGGIYSNSTASIKISNCTIKGNSAINYGAGGGIFCYAASVTNCVISGNQAYSGGGIKNCDGNTIITDCVINSNQATDGGGIYCYGSNTTITNCVISNNQAYRGGATCGSSATITNCVISSNQSNYGGGIYNYEGSTIATNCTIINNVATQLGGVNVSSGNNRFNSCIIWGNTAKSNQLTSGGATISYSDVQESYIGEGNINVDPMLEPDGFHLRPYSPCINAGDPNFNPGSDVTDIDGEPRVVEGRIDMGADEYQGKKGQLTEIRITGLAEPLEGASVQYIATAYYEDGYTAEVTTTASWWLEPAGGGEIDAGLLQTEPIKQDRDITIHARYVENSITVETELTVLVRSSVIDVPADYETIQSAIDAAYDGVTVIVAPGTYTGPGNWDIDFLGKAITVRSENGPNDCIIDCNDPIYYGDGYVDFYYHFGFGFSNNEDANSVIDGFTITNCYRYNAIECGWNSPTIKNCIITGNSGGILCNGSGRPAIINCTISNNGNSGIRCEYGYPYSGGPTITDCIISGNKGYGRSGDGGGISVISSLCFIYNSVISGHTTNNGQGGGIYCRDHSQVTAANCLITGNSAYEGGGIYCRDSSSALKLTNCTITNNLAKHSGGGIGLSGSAISVTGSIVWGNADSNGRGLSAQIYSGNPIVWFSCIQDDNPNDANTPFGTDNFNIDDDPCFVAPGFWDVNTWHNGDYHLLPNSPCIEAGDPSLTYHPGDVDIDGQPRLMGRRVDMGADEFDIKMIVVTKPKGGEVWTGGSSHEITWDSFDVTGTVDISYSINNGANWIKIANAPDTGSFTWHLPVSQFPPFCHKPPVDSNKCLILVEPNTPVSNFTCIKGGLFTIQPYRNWPPQPWWPGYPLRQFGPKYGCVKWQFQTGGLVTAGVTIGLNNRVHVPCEDGKLYTLNPGGKLLWTYDTNSPLVCSPAVDRSSNVYAGAENGKLYAIDKNGRLLWTHTTDGPVYSSPVVLFDDPWCGYICPYWKKHSPPWEQPIQIFVGSVDGALYALAQDGSELWTFETDSISAVTTGAIFASPAIDHSGTLHIDGIHDTNLYALDSNNADIKWNRPFPDPCRPYGRRPWPFASPVIAENGTIYQALLYDPNLYAINPNDGSIIWSTNLADPCSGWFEPNYAKTYGPASCWSKPALAPNGTIYVSFNDPYLRAVNPNGTIKWVTKLGTIGGFTLTVGADGLIYAASDDARLYVVNPNGQQVSQFEGFSALSFPTITIGRTVLVSDANNTVWAIGQYNCCGQASALHRLEDLNGDGIVDDTDLAVLIADWLNCTDTGAPCNYKGDQIYLKGDLNKDQYVDFADFAQLANRWLNKE